MNRGFRDRNVVSVELNRDGLNSPWGLRLKGGKDVDGGTPLEITRVSRRLSTGHENSLFTHLTWWGNLLAPPVRIKSALGIIAARLNTFCACQFQRSAVKKTTSNAN